MSTGIGDRRRRVYQPLANRLTVLADNLTRVLLSVAAVGAVAAGVTRSGGPPVIGAAAMALIWTLACLRTRLEVGSDYVFVRNRWGDDRFDHSEIIGLEARHLTDGLFGGSRSPVVVAFLLGPEDTPSVVKVEVTASTNRAKRKAAVEFLGEVNLATGGLGPYLDGYV